jgi:hypothetical protein
MLVKATQLGYYNDRRQKEGSVFKLVDKKYFVLEDKKDKSGKIEKDKAGKAVKVKVAKVTKAKDQYSVNWMEPVDESEVAQEVLDHVEAVATESVSTDVI